MDACAACSSGVGASNDATSASCSDGCLLPFFAATYAGTIARTALRSEPVEKAAVHTSAVRPFSTGGVPNFIDMNSQRSTRTHSKLCFKSPRSAPSFSFSMSAPDKVMYCTSKPFTEGFTMYCTKPFSAKTLNAALMVAYQEGKQVCPWDPEWRLSTLRLLLLCFAFLRFALLSFALALLYSALLCSEASPVQDKK